MSLPDHLLNLLTVAGILGCGLMGGTFFAFSSFVMKALARLPGPGGMAAMQSINVAVLNPVFLGCFLGTGLACLGLIGWSVMRWEASGASWRVAGAALYLAGNVAVTMVCNVPRNEALAGIDAARPEAAEAWREYVQGWSRWNHVRTLTALGAAAALATALLKSRT